MIESGKRFRCRARDWNAMAKASNSPAPIDRRLTSIIKNPITVRFKCDSDLIGAYTPVILGDPINTPTGSLNDIFFSGTTPGEIEEEEIEYDNTSGMNTTLIREIVYSFKSYQFHRVGISLSGVKNGELGFAVVSGVCFAWIEHKDIDVEFANTRKTTFTGYPTVYESPEAQNREYRPHYGVGSKCDYLKSWNAGKWHQWNEDTTTDGGANWVYTEEHQYFSPTIPIFEMLYYTKIERQDGKKLAAVRFRNNLIGGGYETRDWEDPL